MHVSAAMLNVYMLWARVHIVRDCMPCDRTFCRLFTLAIQTCLEASFIMVYEEIQKLMRYIVIL